MLESLLIQKFQKHEHRLIEFDPHITTLAGTTDCGKTSILRMLELICHNKAPKGSYISWGHDDWARGRLKVDGHTIVRKKGPGINLYKLDGGTYKSFGPNVPEDIAKILNMDSTNWQLQHSSFFWLADTPGEVSKELNTIVNLGMIDSTLGNIASLLRKARSIHEVSKDRLVEAKSQRDLLKWVPVCAGKLGNLVKMKAGIEERASRAMKLASLVERASTATITCQRANFARTGAESALALGQKAIETSQRAKALQTLLGQLKLAERLAAQHVPDTQALDKHKATITTLGKKADRLQQLLTKIAVLEIKTCRLSKETKQAEKELHQAMKGGSCPICQKPL